MNTDKGSDEGGLGERRRDLKQRAQRKATAKDLAQRLRRKSGGHRERRRARRKREKSFPYWRTRNPDAAEVRFGKKAVASD
jgi:hypothetical protein